MRKFSVSTKRAFDKEGNLLSTKDLGSHSQKADSFLEDDFEEMEDAWHVDECAILEYNRKLIPRVVEKDNPIDERVIHCRDRKRYSFKWQPNVTEWNSFLPFLRPGKQCTCLMVIPK